ncbi:MAG: hypothetical protein QOJ16_2193 [Acidobacteriota bacterium]|nr:hypothetical protein [Acidobacteriota bacterium]
MRGGLRWIPAVSTSLFLLAAGPAGATQVRIFRTQTSAAFAAGTLSGVSLDSLGRIELAPRAQKLAAVAEPFLLSAAVHGDGFVVGTGNAGKVLAIDGKGKVSELFAAPEPEVFAVWVDKDGTVFAGTSPHGKVYRIPPGGKGEMYYDPGETYIWALARGGDGGLLVATGTQGKLFRVDGKGQGRVIYDSDDTHLRSLAVLPDGDVLIGTAGEGLILRLGRDGQARTLYDAKEPEVVALTIAPDGTCYAAVVASEASLTEIAKPAAAPAPGGKKGGKGGGASSGGGEPTVTVTVEGEGGEAAPAVGRKDSGPKSEILRISPSGVVERVWTFNEDTLYSLLWQGGALWVGTGLEGKLYRYADNQMLLEKDVDERQIVALLPGGAGPAFATTNGGALYRVTAGREEKGTYTSAALDTGQVARFGSFRWRGDAPEGSSVRVSFRSGVSSEPDKTWSPWTAPKEGDEIAIADLPRGRYVQWRAELRSGPGGSPRLYSTELSYRQENLSPRVDALAVLEPGQILVPAAFNPGSQVFEPAHPNREGIFTTLESTPDDGGRVKPLWKRGYRALRWAVSDPNEDKLVYSLWFRPAERSPEPEKWLKVVEDLDEDHYNFDATVLPDGIYRFRLVASDRKSNDPAEAKTAEQVSEPVVVDQTPPVLVQAEVGDDHVLHVRVKDALSPIREAVASVDASEWKPVKVADGLLDGKAETLLLEPATQGGLLLLRVTDAAYNVVTFDLSNRH